MKTFLIGIIFSVNYLLAKKYLVEVGDDFFPKKSSDYNAGIGHNRNCKMKNCEFEIANCHRGPVFSTFIGRDGS